MKRKLWAQVIDNLKGMIHAMRYNTKGYDLLTAFLFFISNLITYYGCAYDEVLKELIYYVNVLRSAPGIVAEMAY